jgi:hypothetical protein
MATMIGFLIWRITLYSYGLLNYFLYLVVGVRSGAFFRKPTEREKNEFLLGNPQTSTFVE